MFISKVLIGLSALTIFRVQLEKLPQLFDDFSGLKKSEDYIPN